MEKIKPVLLLADSQLLFIKNEKQEYYLRSIFGESLNESSKCAYIGASNNDDPEFYALFTEAMKLIGISDTKMITSKFSNAELQYLQEADLILLAGGDAELGLKTFRDNSIDVLLQEKHQEGTILVGVSAGAIQLGWELINSTADKPMVFTEGLKIVPFMVLAHSNKDLAGEVESILKQSSVIKRLYEIPFGAGVIYHADNTVEAIKKPINEFVLKDDEVFIHTLIYANRITSTI